MIITEQWMERVAEFLKLPSERTLKVPFWRLFGTLCVHNVWEFTNRHYKVRRLNFYHDGDATPYGQIQPKVHVS